MSVAIDRKPMLASDAVESKLRFPIGIQPKIDGVRGLNQSGVLTGRSLKQHANKHTTNFFSDIDLAGLDGELAAEAENHPELCSLTTSALNTIEGKPWIMWHLFDALVEPVIGLPYVERYKRLVAYHDWLKIRKPHLAAHTCIVPMYVCNTLEEALAWDDNFLDNGMEGSIFRDLQGMHKAGRSTVKEGGLLRLKRFVDFEGVVSELIEGEKNTNDAQINELGHTFRSSHQSGMVAAGRIGAMMVELTADVVYREQLLFTKGTIVKVGAGRLTGDERVKYWIRPELIKGRVVKCKLFPKGIKDKPRFPTFQSFRMPSDI